jgi:hypothetical protein
MHPNFDNACHNVVNHVSNAHAAFAGHSVACVATSKRLLGRKRLSTQPQYQADDSMSDQRPDAPCASGYHLPDMSSPRDSMSRGEGLALRTRALRARTWPGNEPAAIWAALVIARALAG